MFPVAMMVCTTAMLSGIGGAALFMPIFLLIFPLLGPEYVLAPVSAIAVALFTEAFGFSSGFVGYRRRKLIDPGLGKSFLYWAVPLAVIGALVAHWIPDVLIRFLYGLLMVIMALIFLKHHQQAEDSANAEDDSSLRTLTDSSGTTYKYRLYKSQNGQTGIGGFLTGMLSAGIGEVVMPQLVKKGKVPIPVAAGTSILVVIITVFSASFAHIATLVQKGGLSAVPWNLLCYSIPGVLVGGQIGTRLQGKIHPDTMERAIGIVFMLVGVAMLAAVGLDFL